MLFAGYYAFLVAPEMIGRRCLVRRSGCTPKGCTARVGDIVLFQTAVRSGIFTLRAKLGDAIAAQCIVIGPVCVCVCLCVCGFVCGSVTYHDNLKLRSSIFIKL